ncbi:Phospholipid:diacylglycerol acyltransferase 1 [Hibiscus syriacus]|uniref:phospholipid:diacylglycerol acyltransferase n=1 Tax=Hibiscus syriacus TaxID=106335 RepID=A0A6A2Z548_HIBSY|nr:phospholipid:diacylglycerol acyltransferase 1-like [Hibiscus syriacus]KAE8686706.1 Phospholipid:diacylglycerol acyltransferase 1 [Hibiscus syriacus]
MSLLRRRRCPFSENSKPQKKTYETIAGGYGCFSDENKRKTPLKTVKHGDEPPPAKGSRLDTWFWLMGCVCVTWWFFLFLYSAVTASLPEYVMEAIAGPLPDPPGVRMRKQGLMVKHPVVFVPAPMTGGLELWEGRKCAQGLFRKRVWGGTFSEVYKRPQCWVEHMSLDSETGLDPIGIRVRPVSGLMSADDFASGYFVWSTLVSNLARIGYEEKTMYMVAYDWRLSFQNTEVRDGTLSSIKSHIERMVATSGGQKAVIVPHSMGALYFLHFMKWVEEPAPMGGGGGPDWCSKHIKAVVNIAAPFLGVPKAVSLLFSAEAKDVSVARAIVPGFLENYIFQHQTLQHVMRLSRSWDSTMSMIPRGGNTIWGGLDWSPEEGYPCGRKRETKNGTWIMDRARVKSIVSQTRSANYGRIISFGKNVAEAPSYGIERTDFRGAVKGHGAANQTCRDSWTEYHGMGFESIKGVADYKAYTAESVVELLRFVAPKTMARGAAHFSYGIADNLDEPKYKHHKYWSNPLETTLPNAPEMEIFSFYGVGLPTERAYVYKLSSAAECYIPFRIDTSTDDEATCLKDGVYSVEGDETVPVISAGFMCAKGWNGKTRFNPSGIRTYIREYRHSPLSKLREGRGTLSGAHVDIMGNFALIEDVMRIAAGASGEELGGNRVHSDISKWSEKINLQL